MSDEHEDVQAATAQLDAADEDPPREPERFIEHERALEPADDDPPVEPRSPWSELKPAVEERASTRMSPDEDPPSEPRGVESIPHAELD